MRTTGMIWRLSERDKERTIPIILLALLTDALIFLKLLQKVNIIQRSRSRLKNINLKLQTSIYFSLNCFCFMSTSIEFSINVFTEFSDKNICHYRHRALTYHPATSCVRDQDTTTAPARHLWETGSLNWVLFEFYIYIFTNCSFQEQQ